MSVFVLPIKHSYIPSWGVWEAVRETMQNGLDEQDQNGHELVVSHKDNILSVRNFGANLDAKALLIGHSTKVGTDLRGQHGEGLNLAMLAAVRAGRKMRIETPEEVWNPAIDYSLEYGERVLTVTTRRRRKPTDFVEVTIELTKQEWEQYQNNFLPLLDMNEDQVIVTPRGSVLLDKAFRGKLFVKGIFVEVDSELKYGYDLKQVTLDRDRRVLNSYDKRWEIQGIFGEASRSNPEKIGKIVFDLLQNDWEDARGFGKYSGESLKTTVADLFQDTHGETAVPVQSIGDSAEMEHFGVSGIVVPQALRNILEDTKVKAPQKVKAEFANAIKTRYSFQDLSGDERDILNTLADRFSTIRSFIPNDPAEIQDLSDSLGVSVHTLIGIPKDILEKLEVVEFFDKKVQGLYDSKTATISLAKSVISNANKALQVLIHELAHRIDGSSDGYKGHVSSIEELWTIVFAYRTTK